MKNLSLLLILFLVIHIPIYSQDTINIPADYSTIQEGINAASNGDLVLVADGLYYENINFIGKAITVASHFILDGNSTHIDNTIIDGSQSSEPDTGSTVIFNSGEDASSILCGFTITGGTGTYDINATDKSGGGIYLFVSSATIKNNIIEYNVISHNSYTNGGGIIVLNSDSALIENNVIRNNSITGNDWSAGGGIAVYEWIQGGYVKVANNKIIDNTASNQNFSSGGGIEVDGGGFTNRLNIVSNYIKGNNSTGGETYSGGLDLYNCSPTVKNNLIIENTADYGGGILIDALVSKSSKSNKRYYRELSKQKNSLTADKLNSSMNLLAVALENNTVVGNYGNLDGGGVSLFSSSPQLMNFIIWGNTAPSGPQISGSIDVQYSDVEGGYSGTGNINEDPQFIPGTLYCLAETSPCVDSGNPGSQYYDIEDPQNAGFALWPALGGLRNDMGHFGGPNSSWSNWPWPVPVELTSFTVTTQSGIVLLNWSTATELNNHGFEIQRSNDKNNFAAIAFINGNGTTTEQHNYTFTDKNVSSGKYYYRLKQVDFDGSYEYSKTVDVTVAPNIFSLSQNFPDPFNPTTTIKYSIPNNGMVTLKVYDILGKEVMNLVNENQKAGDYSVKVNASKLSSGVYIYRLESGQYSSSKKMIFLK